MYKNYPIIKFLAKLTYKKDSDMIIIPWVGLVNEKGSRHFANPSPVPTSNQYGALV